MKNTSTLDLAVLLTIVFLGASFGKTNAQIANNHPHDTLIHLDPDVIFTEMFEQPLTGYINTTNFANITYDVDVPAGSQGLQSGKFTSYHTPQNLNGTEVRKKFAVGVRDSVFMRFYVKYNNDHRHHHSGIYLHGSNPTKNCFPCYYPGRVGVPPGGDSVFALGAELRGSTITPQTNSRFGMYNYWTGMHPNNANVYYGNEFLNGNPNAIINTTQWQCIEVMIKLNDPVTDSTGEAKLWINGQLIEHYKKGYPNGSWNQLTFTQGAGQPFEGFNWRTDSLVKFHSIWIKNYTHLVPTDTSANVILYDHVVVAKKYIGPIYEPIAAGVSSEIKSAPIFIYPNPANEILRFSSMVQQVNVFNIFGQIVAQKENTEVISVADLQEGLYIIQTDGTFHKIIVKH